MNHMATPPKCLLLGLGGAGKTTLLQGLKGGKYIDEGPTTTADIDDVPYSNGQPFAFRDIGGVYNFLPLTLIHDVLGPNPILQLSS